MASLPYMPFFVGAYTLDAGHLTEQEHGAYLRLLMLAWSSPECRMPNDDAWLARRLSRPMETIARLYRPIIAEFFSSDGNWLFQKRQKIEWERARKNARAQSANAKSRWKNGKDASGGSAAGMPLNLHLDSDLREEDSHRPAAADDPPAREDVGAPAPPAAAAEPTASPSSVPKVDEAVIAQLHDRMGVLGRSVTSLRREVDLLVAERGSAAAVELALRKGLDRAMTDPLAYAAKVVAGQTTERFAAVEAAKFQATAPPAESEADKAHRMFLATLNHLETPNVLQ